MYTSIRKRIHRHYFSQVYNWSRKDNGCAVHKKKGKLYILTGTQSHNHTWNPKIKTIVIITT